MAKISRIIPFSWWPANWGLTGSRRATAHAEYHYDGEDLDYRLLDIKYPELSDKESDWSLEYRLDKLKLDYKYHKIGEYDYGLGLIEFNPVTGETDRARELAKFKHKFGKITSEELEYELLDLSYITPIGEAYFKEKLRLDVRFGKKTAEEADHELLDLKYADNLDSIDYKIAKLGLELQYNKITQNQYDKDSATLLREPWFNVIGADKAIQGENVNMAIELDWNPFFVDFLRSKGWTGHTDDEIVDKWFEEAMRQMLDIDEEGNPIDDGTADPMPSVSSHVRKKASDDGLTEYS